MVAFYSFILGFFGRPQHFITLVLAYLTDNFHGILKKREKPTAHSHSLSFTEGRHEATKLAAQPTAFSVHLYVPPAHLPL